MQPEAGLGYIDEQGRVTVVVAGQWTHEDQDLIAHALDLPHDQVRVIYPAIGGAFGGREDMSIQIVLALAVSRVRRPIKTIWSREESILLPPQAPPDHDQDALGRDRERARSSRMEATVVGDAGAYNYTSTKVLANANLMITGPYEVPNCHIDTYAVYTNNIPTGAFRGFGAPQACFAAEGMMNRLAEALGIDPVELRLRNSIHEGSYPLGGDAAPGGREYAAGDRSRRARKLLDAGRAITWRRTARRISRKIRRCGAGSASPAASRTSATASASRSRAGRRSNCTAARRSKRWSCGTAAAEVGQGSHTAIMQMAAEAVGVPFECVRLIAADTAETQTSGSVSASRMTFMAGNAMRGAAAQALAAWKNEERPAKATFQYRPPKTTPYDPMTGQSRAEFRLRLRGAGGRGRGRHRDRA